MAIDHTLPVPLGTGMIITASATGEPAVFGSVRADQIDWWRDNLDNSLSVHIPPEAVGEAVPADPDFTLMHLERMTIEGESRLYCVLVSATRTTAAKQPAHA